MYSAASLAHAALLLLDLGTCSGMSHCSSSPTGTRNKPIFLMLWISALRAGETSDGSLERSALSLPIRSRAFARLLTAVRIRGSCSTSESVGNAAISLRRHLYSAGAIVGGS